MNKWAEEKTQLEELVDEPYTFDSSAKEENLEYQQGSANLNDDTNPDPVEGTTNNGNSSRDIIVGSFVLLVMLLPFFVFRNKHKK